VTVKQAAVRLEVSSATIYGLVAAGKLKCHRVGLGRGAIRITEEHVVEFLKGAEPTVRTVTPPAPARIVKLKHLRSN
jgi:excisionase family DNA binding protein